MRTSRGARARPAPGALATLALAVVPALLGACGDRDGVRDGAAGTAPPPPPPGSRAALAAPTPEEHACIGRLARAERTVESSGWKTLVQGPPGASRETRLRVLRFADGRTHLSWEGTGDRPALRWDARGRAPWASRTELVLRNYAVVEDDGPGPTVAWRATRRVRFVPRRAERPSLELLADAETGLVLAETHRSASGEEVFVSRYESIEFGTPAEPPPVEPAAVEPAAVEPTPDRACGIAFEWTPLRVAVLPDGFVPVDGDPGTGVARGDGGDDVRREDFTDGVAVVSVVQRPARAPGRPSAEAPREGDCRRRAWRGGASLEGVIDGVEVRVSGTLPPSVLQTVLAGLERLAPPSR